MARPRLRTRQLNTLELTGLRIKAKAIAKSQMRSIASARPSPRNVQLAASFAPTGWLDPAIGERARRLPAPVAALIPISDETKVFKTSRLS